VALYMQPVRVYKVSCLLLQVGVLGLAGFMYILRTGFFLGRNQVGKYRGPRGHTLVSSPRVLGIVEDYGRDSNSRSFLIAQTVFALPVKTQRHSEHTNDVSSKICQFE
jgi:hypothetical protein